MDEPKSFRPTEDLSDILPKNTVRLGPEDNLQGKIEEKDETIQDLNLLIMSKDKEIDRIRSQLNKQNELYLLTSENQKIVQVKAELLEKILKTIIDSFAGRRAL